MSTPPVPPAKVAGILPANAYETAAPPNEVADMQAKLKAQAEATRKQLEEMAKLLPMLTGEGSTVAATPLTTILDQTRLEEMKKLMAAMGIPIPGAPSAPALTPERVSPPPAKKE